MKWFHELIGLESPRYIQSFRKVPVTVDILVAMNNRLRGKFVGLRGLYAEIGNLNIRICDIVLALLAWLFSSRVVRPKHTELELEFLFKSLFLGLAFLKMITCFEI